LRIEDSLQLAGFNGKAVGDRIRMSYLGDIHERRYRGYRAEQGVWRERSPVSAGADHRGPAPEKCARFRMP